MIGVFRRACLFVVPVLVLSVGAAAGECSWLLWQHTIPGTDPWNVVAAWQDRATCDSEMRLAYGRLKITPPPGGTAVQLQSADGGLTSWMRFVCIPDTVDPRGPKTTR